MFSISTLLQLLVSLSLQASTTPSFHGQIKLSSRLSEDFHQCQGLANRAHDIAIHDSTVFDIASLNKSFIANLVLQAVADGHWKRQSKLNDLLARYGFQARFKGDINLHQMLCHRSGLADYGDLKMEWQQDDFRAFKRQHFGNHQYLDFIAEQEHRAPESQFYYSNFAYHILAILLEAAYEKPFDLLLQEKICDPLTLSHTGAPSNRREVLMHEALAYEYDEESESYLANDYIDLSLGRRIYSTANDLMKWLDAQGGAALLPDSLAGLVFQNQVADLNPQASYGYGWVPYKAGDSFAMGDVGLDQAYFIHGGSTEGFQSLAISVNDGETKLVLLSNHGGGQELFRRAQKILMKIYE